MDLDHIEKTPMQPHFSVPRVLYLDLNNLLTRFLEKAEGAKTSFLVARQKLETFWLEPNKQIVSIDLKTLTNISVW